MRLILTALLSGLAFAGPVSAGQNAVNIGTTPNNERGDAPRTAFVKLNANDAELYTAIANINAALASITLTSPVTSVAGRSGAVSLSSTDISDVTNVGRSLLTSPTYAGLLSNIGAAPLVSPALLGVPTAPNPTASDNSTQIANTSWVRNALGSYLLTATAASTYLPTTTAAATYAPLVSPTFSGTATAATFRIFPVTGQNLGVILNQTLSGTASGALSGNYLAANDTAVADAAGTTTFWNMAHVIGAGVQGHRNSFQLVTTFNGADNGVTQNPYYVTFGPALSVTAGDGGTVDGGTGQVSYTSGRGAYFVANPVLKAANAPNIQELSVYEYNISADANTTVAYKSFLALVALASDKSQGTVKDDMITLSAQPGAVGSRVLINASAAHGAVPFNTGSTILKAAGGTLLNGVDFSGLTITSNAWSSPGMVITGDGYTQFQQNRGVQWDVGAGISPGTHGAQMLGVAGNMFFDNWDANFVFRAPVTFRKTIIESTAFTPASSTAACTTGQHAWDTSYEYRCTATNTWKRAALTTF